MKTINIATHMYVLYIKRCVQLLVLSIIVTKTNYNTMKKAVENNNYGNLCLDNSWFSGIKLGQSPKDCKLVMVQ